jgi:hypothetical protein
LIAAEKSEKKTVVNFSIMDANDLNNAQNQKKFADIIELSEKVLGIEDYEVEVEFQALLLKYDIDSTEQHLRY